MKHNLLRSADSLALQHHFHQYFELLLGVEKERLLRAVAAASPEHAAAFQHDINERFAYLKGAVRMGRLLGLISSEEAKMKHELLIVQCADLHSNCLGKFGEQLNPSANGINSNGREQLKRLLGKMTPEFSVPPIDCRTG